MKRQKTKYFSCKFRSKASRKSVFGFVIFTLTFLFALQGHASVRWTGYNVRNFCDHYLDRFNSGIHFLVPKMLSSLIASAGWIVYGFPHRELE